SVPDSALRPTGPAAMEASAPSVNLLPSRSSMPFGSMTSRTKSLDSPAGARPQLQHATLDNRAPVLRPVALRLLLEERPQVDRLVLVDLGRLRHAARQQHCSWAIFTSLRPCGWERTSSCS